MEHKEFVNKLQAEAEGWLGTKYKHRCYHKGLACDCIGFLAGVLINTGVLDYDLKKMPHYPRDYHLHRTRSLLHEELLKHIDCEEVDELEDGCMLLFNFGKAAGHIGLYIDGWLYEAVDGSGVLKTLYKNSAWKDKLSHIIRIRYENLKE